MVGDDQCDLSLLKFFVLIKKKRTTDSETNISKNELSNIFEKEINNTIKNIRDDGFLNISKKIDDFLSTNIDDIHKLSILTSSLSNIIVTTNNNLMTIYLSDNANSFQLNELWQRVFKRPELYYKGRKYGIYDYEELIEILAEGISSSNCFDFIGNDGFTEKEVSL